MEKRFSEPSYYAGTIWLLLVVVGSVAATGVEVVVDGAWPESLHLYSLLTLAASTSLSCSRWPMSAALSKGTMVGLPFFENASLW